MVQLHSRLLTCHLFREERGMHDRHWHKYNFIDQLCNLQHLEVHQQAVRAFKLLSSRPSPSQPRCAPATGVPCVCLTALLNSSSTTSCQVLPAALALAAARTPTPQANLAPPAAHSPAACDAVPGPALGPSGATWASAWHTSSRRSQMTGRRSSKPRSSSTQRTVLLRSTSQSPGRSPASTQTMPSIAAACRLSMTLRRPTCGAGCRNCDSFTVDLRWREAFGVYLCAHHAPSMQRGPHATALVSIAYCTGMKMPNSRPRPLWLWPAGAIRASEMWTSYRR